MAIKVNCRNINCEYSEEVEPVDAQPRCPDCGSVTIRRGTPETPDKTKSDKV